MGGGGGVMNWAIGIDTYTLMCTKWMINKNLLYKNKTQKFKKKTNKIKLWLGFAAKCQFRGSAAFP